MDGQMDRWMDGWMGGQTDGWVGTQGAEHDAGGTQGDGEGACPAPPQLARGTAGTWGGQGGTDGQDRDVLTAHTALAPFHKRFFIRLRTRSWSSSGPPTAQELPAGAEGGAQHQAGGGGRGALVAHSHVQGHWRMLPAQNRVWGLGQVAGGHPQGPSQHRLTPSLCCLPPSAGKGERAPPSNDGSPSHETFRAKAFQPTCKPAFPSLRPCVPPIFPPNGCPFG